MSKIIAAVAGVFGPYRQVEQLIGRVCVWPLDAPEDSEGADLPHSVIGAFEVHEVDLPVGFTASDFDWIGGELVRKLPSGPDVQ